MTATNLTQSILILEKNIDLCKEMEKIFQYHGFQTWIAHHSDDALRISLSLKPDAIVIGLDFRNDTGIDFCRQLRQTYLIWIPIILISNQADELDVVLGLELGADDYMIKPLRLKELVARVKSAIRRGRLCCIESTKMSYSVGIDSTNMIKNGLLTLDPANFSVFKQNESIELTRKEYELIHYLMKNKGKAFSRSHLLQVLSGDDPILDKRIIDVFISRIRQKIETNNRNPQYIKTVRNVGYVMKEIPIMTENVKN
ncbi:response regulator transcription factor [Salipaludibacillus daqingensis]|uniref:response regulator transcription factor n=1 Tax=Salipaludibacillus daqingensis TaxID=3041001 RepID=UPI0024758601|nr:response regulator transcription factor [Salipaludibacillus daqingensis]